MAQRSTANKKLINSFLESFDVSQYKTALPVGSWQQSRASTVQAMAPSSIPLKRKKESPKRASRNSQATPFKASVVETKGNAVSISYDGGPAAAKASNKTIDPSRKTVTSLSFASNVQRADVISNLMRQSKASLSRDVIINLKDRA
jgi:hypothetical protein